MIERNEFGKTGHQSSRIIFGGGALWTSTEKESREILELLLSYGINHIDTSASYAESEKWIGTWVKDHRDRFFLATKIDSREHEESQREFENSLKTLNTDQVDLLQMHEIVKQDDLAAIFDTEGAFTTLRKAKESGKARFIGITGHGYEAPELLSECLDRYPFDSVLLPFNHVLSLDEKYMREFSSLENRCRKSGVALQTMKAIARGDWGDAPRTRNTWYRPLEEQEHIDKTVHWVLSHPGIFTCSAGDRELLEKTLIAADSFHKAPSDEEMRELNEKLGIHMPSQHQWPRLQH